LSVVIGESEGWGIRFGGPFEINLSLREFRASCEPVLLFGAEGPVKLIRAMRVRKIEINSAAAFSYGLENFAHVR
jgi:hypothetical protein